MSLRKSQQSLREWTKQDWGTKSGKPSAETGERYLPKKAIAALSDSEYKATSDKKRKDTAAGKQHSPQTKKARRVARQFRYVGGLTTQERVKEPPLTAQEIQDTLLYKDNNVNTTTPDVGSITPLSFYEAQKIEKSQLSSDPVIAKVQKFGRNLYDFFVPQTTLDVVLSGTLPAKTATTVLKGGNKVLPIEQTLKKNKENPNLFDIQYDEIDNLPIDRKKLTDTQKNYRGFRGNNIRLDEEEISLIEEHVKRSTPDNVPLINMLDETGLTINSQAYLNKFADKNKNITVYRYLHLSKDDARMGKELKPEKGVVSTSLNPTVAINEARTTGKKTELVISEKGKKQGYTPSPFDDIVEKQFAESEGLLVRRDIIPDETVVVEYKVPINKVKGYFPVIKESIDEGSKKEAAIIRTMRERADDIEYKKQEYLDEGFDEDYLPSEYEIADEITDMDAVYDIDYNLDADEFEVIADLTNIKPTNVYKINEKTISLKKTKPRKTRAYRKVK